MSPLLRFKSKYFSHQLASLGLHAVALLRVQNALAKRLVEKHYASVIPSAPQQASSPNLASPNPQAQPWASAMHTLENLMAQSTGQLQNDLQNFSVLSSQAITLVLSNQLVRYKIIPAMPALSSADKVMAVATHCMRESFGDSVDDWMIRVNPLPHGDSLVISAVDAELISAIEFLCKKYQFKLKSIQPYLMSGFNSMRRQIRAGVSCLAQVEVGRLTIALTHDGDWKTITATTSSEDWSADLAALISRELLLAGLQNAQASIYFSALPSVHDEKIKQLFKQNNPAWLVLAADQKAVAGYDSSQDQPYTMALSAVF